MKRAVALAIVLAALSIAPRARAAAPGEAGATFLRLGFGARAAAMGGAAAAVATDASAVYWNPAAMAPLQGSSLVLSHNDWIQSVRLEQAAVVHETDFGTFGLAFTGLSMDDLERREAIPTAEPLGTFGAYDLAFALAYARYVVPNVAVGLSVKPIYQRIDDLDALGLAVDAGIYHVSRVRGLTFAAVATNLGAPMKFDQQEYALPRSIRVGGAWRGDLPWRATHARAAFDLMFPNDDDPRTHVGVELDWRRRVYVRAGYRGGYDSMGASFGLGVVRGEFGVDYAFVPLENDLGDSHRVSLTITL